MAVCLQDPGDLVGGDSDLNRGDYPHRCAVYLCPLSTLELATPQQRIESVNVSVICRALIQLDLAAEGKGSRTFARLPFALGSAFRQLKFVPSVEGVAPADAVAPANTPAPRRSSRSTPKAAPAKKVQQQQQARGTSKVTKEKNVIKSKTPAQGNKGKQFVQGPPVEKARSRKAAPDVPPDPQDARIRSLETQVCG